MATGMFAERLRELRTAAGLTQQQLADKAGLKYGAVRDLEQRKNGPTWETVVALCEALNVSCEAFREPPAATPEPPRRGRPKKAAQPAQDATASGEAAGGSTAAEKPAARRRKPRKGKG